MTPLRQRMINDMTVRGLASSTIAAYLHSVIHRMLSRVDRARPCGVGCGRWRVPAARSGAPGRGNPNRSRRRRPLRSRYAMAIG